MRILVVGANGTLGKAVSKELEKRHEVIKGGRSSGDALLDLSDPSSILAAFKAIGPLDAVFSTAGNLNFLPLEKIEPATIDQSVYGLGLKDKLMGQVNLALTARDFLKDGGSITLISGILSDETIVGGSSGGMVSNAIDGFVRAAAIELPRGLRINAVSPSVLEESMEHYGEYFRGIEPVSALRATCKTLLISFFVFSKKSSRFRSHSTLKG